jgi:hypothetical protein
MKIYPVRLCDPLLLLQPRAEQTLGAKTEARLQQALIALIFDSLNLLVKNIITSSKNLFLDLFFSNLLH